MAEAFGVARLLVGVFELKEPGDSVRLLEVLDLVNEVGDRVGMSQARDRLRCFIPERQVGGRFLGRFTFW
jgi:hypothetical protein